MTKLFFFDLETTGLPTKLRQYDRDLPPYSETKCYEHVYICSMAYIVVDCATNQQLEKQYFLLKPDGYRIDDTPQKLQAQSVHKLTQQELEEQGITYDELFQRLETIFSLPEHIIIAGHNISFDMKVLASTLWRRDRRLFAHQIGTNASYCTCKNGRIFMKQSKFPKLPELYEYCTGETLLNAHNALADIEATYQCYLVMKGSGK